MERRIDDLGRIAIPKEIRQELNIEVGDVLEICLVSFLDGNKIVIQKKEGAE